ncbi:hypothetical protein LPJ56_002337 [Coemansia sp. RSA 2599]|nr:hypothetical protein LPJ56_002337 [Coemansia sp. RSA 2599]
MSRQAIDQGLSQLLEDISAQRQQATQFARLVEQESMYQTPVRGRRRQAPADVYSELSTSPGVGRPSDSPPESFLEGFARDFVDNYRPERPPVRIFGRSRKRRAGREKPRMAELCEPYESISGHGDEGGGGDKEGKGDGEGPLAADDSWMSKIDRGSRMDLWTRVADVKSCGRHVPGTPEERRIVELVPTPDTIETSAPAQCWSDGEWQRWAAFVVNVGRSSDMHRRLDWVHEQQPDAWQHGFRDQTLLNGKLRRIYRSHPVELQAYPDGNVKRVASVTHEGQRCTSTTLYFANGDWQCSVAESMGRVVLVNWYYYCDESIWSRQEPDGCVEYRYADGRVERTDGCGTTTVTYPSGDVVVRLGNSLCSAE